MWREHVGHRIDAKSVRLIAIHLHNTGKHNCATGDLSKEANAAFLKEPKAILKTSGFTQLPVRIHIVTLDDGTGGISLNDINQAIANLNFVYQQEDIEFFIAESVRAI